MDKAEKYLKLEMGGVNNWYGCQLPLTKVSGLQTLI